MPQAAEKAALPLAGDGRPARDEGRVSESRDHETEEAEFGPEEDGEGQAFKWEGCECLYPW